MDKIPVIAVVGPTASGKTALAVKIAQNLTDKLFLPTQCRFIRV